MTSEELENKRFYCNVSLSGNVLKNKNKEAILLIKKTYYDKNDDS